MVTVSMVSKKKKNQILDLNPNLIINPYGCELFIEQATTDCNSLW